MCVHRSRELSSSSYFECWSTFCLFWSSSVSCCFQTLLTQNHFWSYPAVMPFTHSFLIFEFPTCSAYPNLTPQVASTMLTNSLFQASKQSPPSCSPLVLCLLLLLGAGKPVLWWSLHIQPQVEFVITSHHLLESLFDKWDHFPTSSSSQPIPSRVPVAQNQYCVGQFRSSRGTSQMGGRPSQMGTHPSLDLSSFLLRTSPTGQPIYEEIPNSLGPLLPSSGTT